MKTIYLDDNTREHAACVATIGMFDGIHLGHRFVISHLCHVAHERGLLSCVVTFDRHPRQVVGRSSSGKLLTTLDERLLLLSKTGVDVCVVLPFTEAMAALTAREFMLHVLQEQLGVSVLLTGYDNRFGHRTEQNWHEGFDDYVSYGHSIGMEVQALPPAATTGTAGRPASSSLIRQLLAEGDVAAANEQLGLPYFLTGTVVSGEHIGTDLGFPTANLTVAPDKLVPAPGVYAVYVRLANSVEQKHGMMNIGHRPTFDGQETTLEVNIFRFGGNLYGQQLHVAFIDRIRAERRFDSPEELAHQLRTDAITAESLLLPTDSTRRPPMPFDTNEH